MPPKARISGEMILEAAFQILREKGLDAITARAIGEALHCSTQPVLYHFSSVEQIKQAVSERADQYHSEYLFHNVGPEPLLEIGLNYVRFAAEEKNIFHLLFQSGSFGGKELGELMEGEALAPILTLLQKEENLTELQAKRLFRILFLTVHGYAGMYAGNEMVFDREAISGDLKLVFTGCLRVLREEKDV